MAQLEVPQSAPPSPSSFARGQRSNISSANGVRPASVTTGDECEVNSTLHEIVPVLEKPATRSTSKRCVDIVVVGGLEGDPEESEYWKADNGCRWLRDLLPKMVPGGRTRILLFKYDAHTILESFGNELNRLMKAQARKLLSLLTEIRDDAQGPLLFIGKGYGGLIVKQALIYSHSLASVPRNGALGDASNAVTEARVAKYTILKSAALGVVFIGTPHRGWKDASGVPYYSQVVPPAELELNKSSRVGRPRFSTMESRSDFSSPAVDPLQVDEQIEVYINGSIRKMSSIDDWSGLDGNGRDVSPRRRVPESIRSSDKLFQWTAGRTAERAYLTELSRHFQHIVTQYEILSIFATKPGKTKQMNVSQSSAVLDVVGETVLPLETTHADLVKFTAEDDKNYQLLAENLRRMVESILQRTAEQNRRLKQQDVVDNIHPPSRTGPLQSPNGSTANARMAFPRRMSAAGELSRGIGTRREKERSKGGGHVHQHRIHLHHHHHEKEKPVSSKAVSAYLEEHPELTKYFPLDEDIPANAYMVTAIRSGQCASHDVNQYDMKLHDLGDGNFPWIAHDNAKLQLHDENAQKLNNGCLWIHVPGNDRSWVEDVVTKVYATRCKDPDALPLEILGDEYWKYREISRDRASRRGTMWMEPSCMLLDDPDDPEPQMALYMPYLHWDTKAGYREQKRAKDALLEAPAELHELYEKNNYDDCKRLRSSCVLGNLRHHPRRTLDQYYYSSLEDTRERDNDQIVGHKSNQILMIDQLWLWVTGKETMFTFFPEKRECEENVPGPLLKTRFADLRDSIIRELEETSADRDLCRDAFELAALTVKTCVNVMLSPQLINAHPNFRVLQIFQDTITETTEKGARALREFVSNPDETELADISSELAQLWRVTDLEDELNMLSHLLYEQRKVLDDFHDQLELHYRNPKLKPRALVLVEETIKNISEYENDVAKKQEHAQNTRKSLVFLLDLKQKNANLQEARITRQQQEQSVQQSRTMMIFTVFTVVFLPLSFFTSLYGMNVQEWSGTPTNPKFKSFGILAGVISTVIILFTLTLAFWTQIRQCVGDGFGGFGRRKRNRCGSVDDDVERLLPLDTMSMSTDSMGSDND